MDMIVGGNQLGVVDAGVTNDASRRRDLLVRKLLFYSVVLGSCKLDAQVVDVRSASVEVTCALPPEPAYSGIESVRIETSDGRSVDMPVEYRLRTL